MKPAAPRTAIAALRAKYAELNRKYATLVARLERRSDDKMAVFRTVFLALQATGQALAILRGGRISVTAGSWRVLASVFQRHAPWAMEGAGNMRSYTSLRDLVLGESTRMAATSYPVPLRALSESGDHTLELRFEGARGGRRIAVVQDVTLAVQAETELLRMREALQQKERLRTLGTLAASVAHDLGTTLRGAALHVEALRRDPKVTREQLDALDHLGLAINSASEVVSNLHNFAKGGTLFVGAVDLCGLAREALNVIAMHARDRAGIKLEADLPRLPPVRGSAGDISHLLVNVLLNALEALPSGGTIRVSAWQHGDGAQLEIADDGVGMPPETLSRVFQPFFTTKGAAGTGLGLWLARATMSRLGGTIEIRSRERRGTTVTLTFQGAASPRVLASRFAAPPAAAAPRRAQKSARGAAPRAPVSPGARPKSRAPRTARRS